MKFHAETMYTSIVHIWCDDGNNDLASYLPPITFLTTFLSSSGNKWEYDNTIINFLISKFRNEIVRRRKRQEYNPVTMSWHTAKRLIAQARGNNY